MGLTDGLQPAHLWTPGQAARSDSDGQIGDMNITRARMAGRFWKPTGPSVLFFSGRSIPIRITRVSRSTSKKLMKEQLSGFSSAATKILPPDSRICWRARQDGE